MNGFFRQMLKANDKLYRAWLSQREKRYAFPPEVEAVLDRSYLPDGRECHKFDVFLPKNRTGKLPAVINLHGGGLVLCTRHVNRPFCAELAKRGFAVFSVDYPLTPEKDACGILADVCEGIRYVEQRLEEYGADPDRVFFSGDSAGAFLAVYAEAARRDPRIARAAGIVPPVLPVRAMGLVSGMFYTTLCDDPGLVMRSEFYGKDWRSHPLMPWLLPDRENVAGLMPPMLLVTSRFDKLRSATMRFAKGLRQAGREVRVLDYPAHPRHRHDFVILMPEKDQGREAVEEMAAFFAAFGQNGD